MITRERAIAIVRSRPTLHRLARSVRGTVHQWFPPALSPEAQSAVEVMPALEQFVLEARRTLRTHSSFRNFLRIAPAFSRLLRSDFLAMYVNSELCKLNDDKAAPGRIVGYGRALRIITVPEFTLKILFLRSTDREEIISAASHTFLAAIGPIPLQVQRYRVPQKQRHGVFEPESRLVLAQSRTLGTGEFLALGAGIHAHAFPSDVSNKVALTLEHSRVQPLSWHYDPVSLQCVRATPTDLSLSRIKETLGLISALKDSQFVPHVTRLYRHPSHFVRWAAVRAMLTLSAPAGARLLRRARADRHPQLRAAARTLLSKGADIGFDA